ncbi:[protein-PII] uridylyltransferase [Jatrophihabitans telluris]|uniref:Bifunctional uridylyltransferase/uridylyl-removing enzyme n=1 Tax=Jatrophihabitans telluris TaxID=2038343 RepID=A0ABY4R4U8_9ACTN|nr:[protein-PII] uridylyltransferase [Jatrophihabitans telluris]UQX89985.1 [protein-PII] uridylyltransferase [Jatrophihabitans telluris]
MKTPSEHSRRSVRAELSGVLARTDLVGPPLRVELSGLYDRWLGELFPAVDGIALIAVGGLGRKEPTPYGDLDLVLLHTGKVAHIGGIADGLWYPIWDAGVGLDHSVRTVEEAVSVAGEDLKAMLGMLDARHIAGDPALTGLLREQVISRWRRTAPGRLPELQDLARSRWATRGDASFLLEPDLKDCRGGLRDWVGLRALASAQLVDLTPAVQSASAVLLDVRGELHRMSGRSADVLRGQDRASVAHALALADGDAVLRSVNEAARTIAYATDASWRRVTAANPPAGRSLLRRLRPGSAAPDPHVRTPLARDVVSQNGEVVLARDADPWADPVLLLRVARAAAEHDLPISSYALARLATESSPMPEPWPAAARTEFVGLLGAGRRTVPALEALDQYGLLSRLMPEWESVRFRAQHNPVHRFTVDRHLVETAVQASSLTADVARPDLLIVGAFLHDIGKGRPGDHSVVGAVLTRAIATRMGFSAADVEVITALTRHHLLLPDTATRRDLDDPSTIAIVLAALAGPHGGPALLELLHALTIADAAATGPAAWSDWKASLVRRLVNRTRAVLGGEPMPGPEPLTADLAALAASGQTRILVDGGEVVVVAPDAPGLLSRTSGLLALHSLDVHTADVRTEAAMAISRFTVSPRFGEFPDQSLLSADLRRVLAGTLALDERLRAKEAVYENGPERSAADRPPPRILWFDDEATDATVIEVRTRDGIGLLHWVTAALEAAGLDIRSARISSLGSNVVDAFYVTDSDGKPLTEAQQAEVTSSMQLALSR